MTHYPTRLTTSTIKPRQPDHDPDSPPVSWPPSPSTSSTPSSSTSPSPGLGQCTPPPTPTDAMLSDRGRQLQFRCTFRRQESPTGLRATWPPALVASPSTQHAVRNDRSLMGEALLVAPGARNALLHGPLASMHCHSHQALTAVTSPFRQRPNLFMLHPIRPLRVQRTVASATTLRECTCHHIPSGDPNICVPLRPRAVGCPHFAHGLR